jgi:tetratricopeptide (TPR) repeat protein
MQGLPADPLFGATVLERADSFEDKQQIAEFDLKGDWAGMLGFAETLEKRDPKRPDWAVVAGYSQLRAGNYRKAIEVLSRVTDTNPEDIGAWNLLGESQRLVGQPERAVQTLDRASAIGRTSFQTFFLLGQAYRDSRETIRAIAAYKESASLESKFARTWFELGLLYVKTGDRLQAQAAQSQLRVLDPDLAKQLAARIEAGK